ncbi:unnamed protein product [Prunus armeniaca]|nr:unnamed protein product [Prunus armeniaca]
MSSAPTTPEMVQPGEIGTLIHQSQSPASNGDQRNLEELKNGADLSLVCILEALLRRLDGAQ